MDATSAEIQRKLAPVFARRLDEHEASAVDLLRDRVRQDHLAVAGFEQTLEQLQAGKLQTLVVARGIDQDGARCGSCGFLFADSVDTCAYCNGPVNEKVDLVEEVIRIAGDQDVAIDFVGPSALQEMGNVGGLLRF